VVCSEDVLFLIVAQVVLPVARARRVDRPDNSPAAVVPCTRRAQRQAALQEQLVPVLGSAPVSAPRVLVLARVQEWAVLQD
jgi:hypothetical protein